MKFLTVPKIEIEVNNFLYHANAKYWEQVVVEKLGPEPLSWISVKIYWFQSISYLSIQFFYKIPSKFHLLTNAENFVSKLYHFRPKKKSTKIKVMNHKKSRSEFKNIKNKHGNRLLVSVFHFLRWFYLVHLHRLSWSSAMNPNLNVISNV